MLTTRARVVSATFSQHPETARAAAAATGISVRNFIEEEVTTIYYPVLF